MGRVGSGQAVFKISRVRSGRLTREKAWIFVRLQWVILDKFNFLQKEGCHGVCIYTKNAMKACISVSGKNANPNKCAGLGIVKKYPTFYFVCMYVVKGGDARKKRFLVSQCFLKTKVLHNSIVKSDTDRYHAHIMRSTGEERG